MHTYKACFSFNLKINFSDLRISYFYWKSFKNLHKSICISDDFWKFFRFQDWLFAFYSSVQFLSSFTFVLWPRKAWYRSSIIDLKNQFISLLKFENITLSKFQNYKYTINFWFFWRKTNNFYRNFLLVFLSDRYVNNFYAKTNNSLILSCLNKDLSLAVTYFIFLFFYLC